MASGQQRFEDEDWLGSYLSSSKYASDPKINAEPKSKVPKQGFFSSHSKKGTNAPAAGPVAPHAAPPGSADADLVAGYNFSASSRASNRRRSWAAPPSGLPGQGQRANPAEAAAAKAIAAAQAAATAHPNPPPKPPAPARPSPVAQPVAATSRSPSGTLPDTSKNSPPPSSYPVPPPPFPENGGGDMTTALQIAAARVVNSASTAKNKRPAGGAALLGYAEPGLCQSSQTEWHEEFTDKTTNFRRKSFSGSGRRVSLDYTDLEAVKERVQQAASLWAVAEDAERESLSSNDAGGSSKDLSSTMPSKSGPAMPMPGSDRGARSAAAQAIAAAKAMQAGEMAVDDYEDSTDDEVEEEKTSPKVVQSAKVEVSSAAPAQPAKKGSLIKKWLVFRR